MMKYIKVRFENPTTVLKILAVDTRQFREFTGIPLVYSPIHVINLDTGLGYNDYDAWRGYRSAYLIAAHCMIDKFWEELKTGMTIGITVGSPFKYTLLENSNASDI